MQSRKISVLILGYGAREHALAWKIAQSPLVDRLYVAPGNAGTAEVATNITLSDEDVPALVAFAQSAAIDLTVVGTNDPLALGVVDAFQAEGLDIVGPTRLAAQLESSKAFAKAFMLRHDIPTPEFAAFEEYEEARRYVDSQPHGRLVVKVSGLGKMGLGVTVCDTKEEARAALHRYMVERQLGAAADTVLVEQRVSGEEVSVFALSDGRTVVPLPPVRDHKRIFDGDRGPNTGGMGAYGPPPDCDESFMADVTRRILQPAVDGMRAEGHPYVGVLFAGLMRTSQGTQVLEFNCRFGNPEALVLMSLLESDIVPAMLAVVDGRLTPDLIRVRPGAATAIMLAAPGYPQPGHPTGGVIRGVARAQAPVDVHVFHHGTSWVLGQLLTTRGRVLAVTAVADDLSSAVEKAYASVRHITFDGAHYRRDIGRVQVEGRKKNHLHPARRPAPSRSLWHPIARA